MASSAAHPLPPMIYGTAWKAENTRALVVQAVLSGFRRIDTACQPKHYREDLVGLALYELQEKHGIPRESLWIQTKFTPLDGQDRSKPLPYDAKAGVADQVKQSVATSLKNLNTTFIDSLLLHSPLPPPHMDVAWKQLELFVNEGTIKQIGVSNCYDPRLLKDLYEKAEVKPRVVQNRFYAASGFDVEIRRFCREKGIEYQSFWTLTANPALLAHPELGAIASRLNTTPEGALYAFMIHGLGCSPLNGTTNKKHMTQDLEVLKMVGKVEAAGWGKLKKLIGDA